MKLKSYTVKRYVVEYYWVEAVNKEEAIEESLNEGGPYNIEVKKITVKKDKRLKRESKS